MSTHTNISYNTHIDAKNQIHSSSNNTDAKLDTEEKEITECISTIQNLIMQGTDITETHKKINKIKENNDLWTKVLNTLKQNINNYKNGLLIASYLNDTQLNESIFHCAYFKDIPTENGDNWAHICFELGHMDLVKVILYMFAIRSTDIANLTPNEMIDKIEIEEKRKYIGIYAIYCGYLPFFLDIVRQRNSLGFNSLNKQKYGPFCHFRNKHEETKKFTTAFDYSHQFVSDLVRCDSRQKRIDLLNSHLNNVIRVIKPSNNQQKLHLPYTSYCPNVKINFI